MLHQTAVLDEMTASAVKLVWPGDCPILGGTMALAHIETTTAICQPLASRFLEPLRFDAVKDTLKVDSILLPVDFTERSIGAAQCAVDLAQRFGAKVTLLHVVQTTRRKSGDFAGENGPLTLGQSRIQLAVAEVLQAVPFRRLTLTGEPARRIVEHARKEGAGLILMPTSGQKRWLGFFDDSITSQVIRRAHCPVWTSVGDTSKPLRLRRVLCALALAPRSGRVLQWASQLADHFKAELTIVHSSAGFTAAHGSCYWSQLHLAREAWARQDIAALQHSIGTRADVRLEAGRPERTVAAAARRIRADLVVIGKSGAFWLPRKLRTTPYDIVCEAPCPVAIY